MPFKPKKPCGYPGCPELTDDYYCSAHRQEMDSRYNKTRTHAYRLQYDGDWPAKSRRFLYSHPFCAECEKHGYLTKATEAHHIVPLSEGGSSDESNLMALCKPCHSRITASAMRKRGR